MRIIEFYDYYFVILRDDGLRYDSLDDLQSIVHQFVSDWEYIDNSWVRYDEYKTVCGIARYTDIRDRWLHRHPE